MDIQKEREAFEEYIISKHKNRSPLILTQRIQHGFSENYIVQGVQDCWETWQAVKAQAVPEQTLESDCMINQVWFMKGTPVDSLIKHAEDIYKTEVIAQNSAIKFGTDDNEHWFAHDVPFFGRVQIDRIEEHGLVEWDIFFNECWQGPFDSKQKCIKHLEECIAEQRAEVQEQVK